MKKAIIIYESKYGNTRLVTEAIADGMQEVPGIETTLSEVTTVDITGLSEVDATVIARQITWVIR